MRDQIRNLLNETGFICAACYVLGYPWVTLSQSAFIV